MHFLDVSTHIGNPSQHKRVQDRAKPAARTCGCMRTSPAFTNAESRDVGAFEPSLCPILLNWLPPLHLRLYRSIHSHGQRSTHPTALKIPLLRHSLLPAVPPPLCPKKMQPVASGTGAPCAHTPIPTPFLALVYKSATHKTQPE